MPETFIQSVLDKLKIMYPNYFIELIGKKVSTGYSISEVHVKCRKESTFVIGITCDSSKIFYSESELIKYIGNLIKNNLLLCSKS